MSSSLVFTIELPIPPRKPGQWEWYDRSFMMCLVLIKLFKRDPCGAGEAIGNWFVFEFPYLSLFLEIISDVAERILLCKFNPDGN